MEERKKRPPINLSDMEDNKPGPERGSLGFAGVDRKESSGEGKKKVNLSQILLPVVIALALSALIMFQYAPSKTFLVSQVKVATDSAAALTTQLGSERGRIDAIVNSMGTYAKKTELDTYAKASQLSGLATTSQLSGYATTAQKDALEAEIVALKARIAVLEAAGVADNTTVGIVTAELKSWGDIAVGSNVTVLDATFKVNVKNTTQKAVEDVVLTLLVRPAPALIVPVKATLTGGYTTWNAYQTSPYAIVFQNSWGLNLKAGETKSLLLSLHLEFGTTASPTMFETKMEVEDYDIVK